ncbi:MAG: cytidine deaminase [Bacteroidales bacterium]|nr:cytidine deaminase [Bacteroidales bacterium]
MTGKEIKITYKEYSKPEELEKEDLDLAKAAIDAMSGSYAPYSSFNVGAAVRLSDGTVVKGANQENAAFPSGLCAERTAMFSAAALNPDKDIVGIALAAGTGGKLTAKPATPCGACRQVMAQYQTKSGKPVSVIMVGAECIWKFDRVDDILPLIFDSI